MSRLPTSISSKNTTLWRPPLTSKSSRRSSRCRVHSPCSGTPKTRRLRHDADARHTRPPDQRTKLPLHYSCTLRSHHNRLNLLTPNRLKIPHRLLLCQPHRSSSWGYPYPNTMRLHRSPHLNNRTRPYILRSLLFGQH